MTSRIGMRVGIVALWLVGSLIGPMDANANPPSMTDYVASPPFITKVVAPNILLLLDISGSLNTAAYAGSTFDPTKIYSGLFEPTECYKRQSGRFVPNPAVDPSSPGTCTDSTYPWSGNLLNYGTMRRIDIVKKVMTGGICSATRDSLGYCPGGGSNYLKAQASFDTAACCRNQTMSVSEANATNRVPSDVLPGGGGNLFFHLVGTITALQGSFCADDDSSPPTGSNCDDGDGYNETPGSDAEYELWIEFTMPQGGVIQQVGDKARMGLMTFNLDEGAGVRNYLGANPSDILNNIDAATPSTWTPLAESLYEAVRFYAQIDPAYSNTPADYTVSQANDPFYFQSPKWASTSAYVDCCKSYVIVFTDGEPAQDQNIPTDLQDFADSVHGAHCTSSPNTDPCTPHKTNYPNNGSHFLDDVAYFAHTTDLRQSTIPVLNVAGKDLTGFQNLSIYTFYAFGQPTGREVLKSTAKAGGFEDQNGNNLPDNGLTGGSAAPCSTTDLTLPCEWDKLNNLTGAATRDEIPDTYFESANADDLKDRLVGAIYSILKRSASGTAASVLASSSTGEGAAYQAYFYPSTADVSGEVKWTGYLHSLWVDKFGNFREDSGADGNPDGRLIYQHDKIVVTKYNTTSGDVLVDRYADADGDGKADSTSCSPCDVPLKELVPIWEAGKQLALKNAADRKILTWVDSDNDGLVDTGEQMEFKVGGTPDPSTTLAPYVLAEGSGSSPFTANNIINYIRGDQITGLRNRQLQVPAGSGTLKVWKLGDIVNGTPTIVGAPKERYDVIYGDSTYTDYFTKYKNRRMVAYVGANDGMLHAINVGYYHRGDDSNTSPTEHGWFTRTATDNSGGPLLGDELWGFIPYQLLPQLQWLTREDYIHTYYVDLKAKVTDARIFAADTDHPNGWGTILIGGFRMGGSCKDCPAGHGQKLVFNPGGGNREFYSAYFVLDITNPEATGYPKLLWNFTENQLGFTTSYPAVVRVSTSTNKTDNTAAKWFAVFGSGTTGYDGRSGQEGRLFAMNLTAGPGTNNSSIASWQSGQGNSSMGDLISLDANLDYRADVVYAGSLIDNGSSPWTGKLYRLTTGTNGAAPFGGDTTANNWGHGNKPTILLYDFACSGSCTGANKPGPMAAAPTVTMDDASNIWVFIGSGRFYASTDKTNTDTQYFFGVKDPVLKETCTQSSQESCVQKDLVNVSSATVCLVGTGDCGQSGGTNQVTGVSGVSGDLNFSGTATTTLQGLVASKKGWYTTLPASRERALSSPTLFAGIVFFPTYTPTATDVCSGDIGSSSLYALFYLTGSAYKTPVIGTEASGGNQNVKRSTSLGAGVASQVGIHIGGEGTDSATGITSREKLCMQMSTGQLVCKQGNPAQDSWSRYLSWINLRL